MVNYEDKIEISIQEKEMLRIASQVLKYNGDETLSLSLKRLAERYFK